MPFIVIYIAANEPLHQTIIMKTGIINNILKDNYAVGYCRNSQVKDLGNINLGKNIFMYF